MAVNEVFFKYVGENFPWFTQSTKEDQAWNLHKEYEDINGNYYRDSNRKNSDDPIPSRARHMAAASGASNAVVDRMRNNSIGKYAPLKLQETIGDTLAFIAGGVNELDYLKAAKQDGIIDATDRLFQDIGANWAGSFGYDRQTIGDNLEPNQVSAEALDSYDSTGQIYNENYLGLDPLEYNKAMADFHTGNNSEKDWITTHNIINKLIDQGLVVKGDTHDSYFEPEYNIWKQFSQ